MALRLLRASSLALAVIFAAGLARAGERAALPPLTLEPIELDVPGGRRIQAERGWLRVPENRRRRHSREITLAFVRLRSTSPDPGHPIVYLAGGPGTSGIGAARSARYPLFAALAEHADVIALDQRGAGESEPSLACSERYRVPFDRATDRARAAKAMARAAKDCVRRLRIAGVDLDGYNTRESAADLDDLRRALRAEKLVLWGMSYGTHLALAALREYPESVDHLVEGAGHGDALFDASPEILAAMHAFLRGARVAPARVAAPPLRFLPPRLPVALPGDVLARYVGSYRSPNGDVRRVFQVGPLLYTQRDTLRGLGPTFPIRAYSPTGFFYEGTMTRIEFELDGEGSVTGMVMYREDAPDGERAIRIP